VNFVPLGTVASVKSGFAFKSKDWKESGIPVIKIANVKDGFVTLDGCSFVDEYVARSAAAFELKPGDTLISMTGYIGEVARVRNEGRMLLNQRVGKFSIKSQSKLDGDFLFYCLREPALKAKFAAHAYGAAQPNISPLLIEQQEIPLPPLPIQQRIASILSAYDELIENSQRRIKILESMARALYREWFVHFRFPGHENHPRVASPLGEIPDGWEVKKLGEVAEVNRAQINARTAPEELHYIDISSVSPGQIDSITTYAFTDAPGRARRVVQNGDVLWSCVRPNRRSHAQVMHPEPNTIASTGFAVLTATKVPFTFLYFATTTDDFVAYLTNNATGAAYPAVTAPTFEKADLLTPSASLLKKFGAATIPMAEEIHTLQRQIQNLRRTRDLLLPRLLSGQIDVEAIA
jgi:type I restriction enzyme S subunit